jgi:uncharacterized membrane protein YcgQ (UPF0703/DUF1980 family)
MVRMFIWCCAAGARPIYVPVEVSGAVDVSDTEWVKVTGVWGPGNTVSGQEVRKARIELF